MPRDARRLHGRERELAAITRELEAAIDGATRILVLQGEAGIGKTALMEAAADSVSERADVLTARNLPLSTRMPNLAVRRLLAQADAGQPPHTGAQPPLPIRLDAAIDRLAANRPVVITVDDLQWADATTLDALMFLAGGTDDRPLAILTTVRSGSGRELDRWRADLLRMPASRSIEVGPLDRLGMHELIAALIGEPPHDALVRDVLARTGGNPYHARLLVEGVAPAALAAPATTTPATAGDLGTALLQTWATLPERTRELTILLAIHGKPIRLSGLEILDPDSSDVEPGLRPALATHVLDEDGQGRVWFHHPLIAELLVASVPEPEIRARHGEIAEAVGRLIELDGESPERLVNLADHLVGAGEAAAGFEASRRAIAAVQSSDDPATTLRLIRRCVELDDVHPGLASDRPALLAEWAAAAAAAEADHDEYAAVDELLTATGTDDPLRRAELLLQRRRLQSRLGGELVTTAGAREVFELTVHAPDSREHALALCELAHAEIIEGDPRAVEHASGALESAHRLGDPEAMSYATAVAAQLAAATRDHDAATRLAEQAFAVAIPAHQFEAVMLAALWEAYSMPGYRMAAERLRELRHRLTAAGAPRLTIAALACTEAAGWSTIAETAAARDALRIVRAEDAPEYLELAMRSVSARVAAVRGRVEEAEAHLHRARERFAEPPAWAALELAVAQAMSSLAAGDTDRALAALMPVIEVGPHGRCSEWLVPLAARALADEASRARDAGAERTVALDALDALEGAHPHVIRQTMGVSYATDLHALDALYAAERARARGIPDSLGLWAEAADGAAAADLAWEEAYACRRGAEQGLVDGGDRRRVAVALLRRGAAIAQRIEADALAAEFDTLAAWARIDLHASGSVRTGSRAGTGRLAGIELTGRERELLPLLVDGRTYAEIADLLTISEKTVSSHVSNLLRKTGAANRVDLARMARGAGAI